MSSTFTGQGINNQAYANAEWALGLGSESGGDFGVFSSALSSGVEKALTTLSSTAGKAFGGLKIFLDIDEKRKNVAQMNSVMSAWGTGNAAAELQLDAVIFFNGTPHQQRC